MIRTIACLLPALALAAPAAAQSEADAAQARVKSLLEAVELPVVRNGARVPGVATRYAVTGSGCATTIEMHTPAFTHRDRDIPAASVRHAIDWRAADSVEARGDRVRIKGTGLPPAGVVLAAGSAAAAEKLDIYFYHGIFRNCSPRYARPPTGGPADW